MAGYICKIVIEDTHPPVWRRVVIPDKITFMELHEIIQILFGWEDEHLHEFQIPSDYITIGSEGAYRGKFYDEEETLIDSFFRNYKWIRYIYDFGDDWRHKINIEKIDINYSLRVATLLKYKGDNFEEDCGGVWGADETGHKVFQQECVNAKFATMKLMAHEELQEVPLLKESVEQLKELVHNLMQLKPEVLQSQLAKMAEDIHGEPSGMTVKISAWREFEEDRETKQLQVIPATKSQAVNFGVENCIIQLLDYKEQNHICSEEYLYLLTEACITFGYTKEAEKLLQQLKSSSVSGKRVAKQLKLRLQERYEVAEDEDDWWEMLGRNSMLQMPI